MRSQSDRPKARRSTWSMTPARVARIATAGRLAYIYLPGNTLLNLEIIRQGYGHAYTRFPFSKMEEFRAAEREAREEGRGLWAEAAAEAESDLRDRSVEPDPQSRGGCIPASQCCKVCRKGKACGNSCIRASYTCRKGRGCACDAVNLCR